MHTISLWFSVFVCTFFWLNQNTSGMFVVVEHSWELKAMILLADETYVEGIIDFVKNKLPGTILKHAFDTDLVKDASGKNNFSGHYRHRFPFVWWEKFLKTMRDTVLLSKCVRHSKITRGWNACQAYNRPFCKSL